MQKDLLPDFLHLYHSFGTRRRALKDLLDLFEQNPVELRRCDRRKLGALGLDQPIIDRIKSKQAAAVTRDLEWARSDDHRLLCYLDHDYPELLRQIVDFPLLLYGSGDISLLPRPQIAIVGSRKCTPGGARTAFEFARELAEAGIVVTSGMARGIDSEAHRGALATGKTIAVVGTGIDRVYPACNRDLDETIRQQGLVLSEFPLQSAPLAANFPQRNRIISGLSCATLVVEAASRSGSLITARLSAEQGREVFAIPGSIHNPQTQGCHSLIRDGATLARQPRDLCLDLGHLFGFALQQQSKPPVTDDSGLDPEHRRLLQAVGYDPVNCDILVQRSGLTIDKLSSMLLVLELNDLIQSAPGGCFVRI